MTKKMLAVKLHGGRGLRKHFSRQIMARLKELLDGNVKTEDNLTQTLIEGHF